MSALWFLVFVFRFTLSIQYQQDEECVSKYGWRGLCKSSWECLALGNLVTQGYEPELCGANGPIVCCPPHVQPQSNYINSFPQTGFTQTFVPTPAYHSVSKPVINSLTKKKKYPSAFLKTYIRDEDDNTIIRITPLRSRLNRKKRKPVISPYRNIRKTSSLSTNHVSYPPDLVVQDDQLSLSYEQPLSSPSAKMCQEYAAFAWEQISELSPTNGVVPIAQEYCPGEKQESTVLESELPFMVALGYEDARERIVWACSGTLISKEYVLTAAHCLHPPLGRPKVARLGTPHLDLRGHGLEVGISEVILHPLYNPADRAANIALLRLAPVPTLGIRIRPACLQTNASGNLLIPFWEKDPTVTLKIRNEEDEVHLFSDPDALTLHKTISVEVDMHQCNTTADDENNMCVQSVKTETCESMTEGGEPLIQTDQYNQCHYSVIGIAIDKACSPNEPTPYTSIAPYVSWIENIVWP